MKIAAIAMAAFAAITAPAHAKSAMVFASGNALYEDCMATNQFDRGYCLGFVAGVADTADAVDRASLSLPIGVCTSDNVKQRQIQDVVLGWLHDHPQDRHYAAAEIVAVALARA